ncbi:hypothetical protein BGZ76_007199 [Entomortierella beljakovae]|nr:hypothetical protein BGZ76_007199 [Entomortierella beljakovae]
MVSSPSSSTSQESGDNTIQPSNSSRRFILPDNISIKLHLRKGQPLVRCRSTKDLPSPTTWEHNLDQDCYSIFCARIRTRLKGLAGLEWPQNSFPYIQPCHTTPQKNYQKVTEDNLEEALTKAWRFEARRLNSADGIYVNIFVYLSNIRSRTQTIGGSTIQRATKTRIDAAHQLISHAVAQNTIPPMGDITTAHFTRHLARLSKMPSQTEPLELPQTNTFRQTQHLDEQARTLDLRRQAGEASQQEEYSTIEVMIEGVILPIRVKIRSLREALNLPNFDLNGLSSFKDDIVLPPEEDMEDIDHADDE